MADLDMRTRLLETAARILDEEGPGGLTIRKLSTEVGTSTMAIYTHFGGVGGLVDAVVDEGFARLARRMAVPETEDAMADLTQLALAYRASAVDAPHLYAVMFGTASLGEYRRTGDDLDRGRNTFEILATGVARAMDAQLLVRGDPEKVAAQLWCALHGYMMLELAGFLGEPEDAVDDVMWPLLANIISSLGVTRDRPH